MKRFLNFLKKPRAAALFLTAILAIALPVQLLAAPDVRIEGSLGVANQTAGDTKYSESTNASFDQVVKFQVYYHNMENAASGKVAQNVKVKATIPNKAGKSQTVSMTVGGDNTNLIADSVKVNLNRDDASLNFIPGSVQWRHNKGTNEAPIWVTEKVSDALVTSGQGLNLGNEKPCYNFEATVTFQARVTVPAVSIDKTVRVAGQTSWVTTNEAKPDDTLEYQIAYKNTGNTTQKNVVIRDNLPPTLTYIAGSTYLKNDSGTKNVADGVTKGGLNVGNYAPGAAAYVKFQVKVPANDKLACGVTEFRNVAVAKPENMGEYFNTAITKVNKVCQPEEPKFSCDALDADKLSLKIGETSNFTARGSASNGATITGYIFKVNGTTVQDSASNKFAYKADKEGTFDVSVIVKTNKGNTAENANCKKQVKVTKETPKPVYECTGVEAKALGSNKYQFKVNVRTEGDVTVNKFIYNFGDGSTEFSTDKNVTEHQFAKPGEYNVAVRVLFNIGNEQKDARCTVKVTIPTNPCPYNPSLPADSPDCKKTPETPVTPGNPPVNVIPSTGAGSVVTGLFGASASAYGVFALVEKRRALKK